MNIINQLLQPFIFVGDFNSHNTLWGCEYTNAKGKKLEKLLDIDNIILLNDNSPTHFNAANGSLSSIDLAITSTTFSTNQQWTVESELYNSDHWPIQILFEYRNTSSTYTSKEKWNLKAPNWELFTQLIELELEKLLNNKKEKDSVEDEIDIFTYIIQQVALLTIKKNSYSEKNDLFRGGTKNAKFQ